jgi:bacterial/archaeal transporter family-2 protein
MQAYIFIIVAIIAGALLPMQAAMNHKIGQTMGNTLWASFISFVVGAVGVFAYMLISKVPLSLLSNAKNVSPTLWLAGFMGAFYVSSIIVLIPRLGVALAFGLIIAGQMLSSLMLDQIGFLGMPIKEISWLRMLGAGLLVAGVVLIRKF